MNVNINKNDNNTNNSGTNFTYAPTHRCHGSLLFQFFKPVNIPFMSELATPSECLVIALLDVRLM